MPRQNFRSRGETLSRNAIDLAVEPKIDNQQSKQPQTYRLNPAHHPINVLLSKKTATPFSGLPPFPSSPKSWISPASRYAVLFWHSSCPDAPFGWHRASSADPH